MPAPFNLNHLVLIGEGCRRKCYRTADSNLCVKFYRRPAEYTKKTTWNVRFHIFLARYIPYFNVNCHEWRYHQVLRRRLPDDLFAAFPEAIEPVYTRECGWGIIESLVQNADRTPVRSISTEMGRTQDQRLRQRLYKEAESFFEQLVEHAVCFYDPPNLMVQWTATDTFRLRIVDFEPRCRAFVPGLSKITPYVRSKVRRRGSRYLKRLRETYAGVG